MTGKYTIEVKGSGVFESGNPAVDADALAKAFLDTLKGAGQVVSEATFCIASCVDLLTGAPKP